MSTEQEQEQEQGKEYTGTVVWFNSKKGYGFIDQDEREVDIFVHYSNISTEPGTFKTLRAEQRVSYTLGNNTVGVQATNVKVLG